MPRRPRRTPTNERDTAMLETKSDTLMRACAEGNVASVRVHVAQGESVNGKNAKGTTPLMWAAALGHAKVVKALLEAGAEVNAANDEGLTPLMLAATIGSSHIVQLLIIAGANVSATAQNGDTALSRARKSTNPGVARYILHSADRSTSRFTPVLEKG